MEGTAVALSQDLDARFTEIADSMRESLEQLTARIGGFRRIYQELASTTRATDAASTQLLGDTRARLQKLELAAAHIASSLAYLKGLATAPGDQDEGRDMAAMVLEGIEHERQRLYRDVHDGPAQVLTNAIFELEFFERIADRAEADIRAQLLTELSTLRSQLRESLDDVRGMIFDLRPPALATLGLAEAMRAYTAEFQSRFSLKVETDLRSGPTGLRPDQELAIYRILQEALQNVHKHANARSVQVAWRRKVGRWTLSIVDDGQGFELTRATRRAKSFGLVTMRERAEVIGATFEIRSSPGSGTSVTLSVRERSA